MKYVLFVMGLCSLLSLPVQAEGYGAMGVGLSEFCDDKGGAFFLDASECESANMAVRGLVGAPVADFLRLEASFDVHLDPWRFFGLNSGSDTREVAAIVGVHGLLNAHLSESVQVFAGPSLGGAMVYVGRDTSDSDYQIVIGNGDDYYTYDEASSTDFSFNYGWTLGVEFETADRQWIRLQWQTWNGLESEVLYPGDFSSNSLFIFFGSAF